MNGIKACPSLAKIHARACRCQNLNTYPDDIDLPGNSSAPRSGSELTPGETQHAEDSVDQMETYRGGALAVAAIIVASGAGIYGMGGSNAGQTMSS